MARKEATLFMLGVICTTLLLRVVTHLTQLPLRSNSGISFSKYVLGFISEDERTVASAPLGFTSDEWEGIETMECSAAARMSAGGVFVSAFSANHFKEMKLLIENAQVSLPPEWRIVIYALGDLGEEIEREVMACCRVELRRFEWGWLGFDEDKQSYEEILVRMKDLTNSLWKPVVISRVVKEVLSKANPCGYVIWGDASVRLKKKLFQPEFIPGRANALGFYGRKTTSPVSQYTHPESFRLLAAIAGPTVPVDPDILDYGGTCMVCGCFSMWHPMHTSIVTDVLVPWVECAKNITCMVPEGAEGFVTLNTRLNINPRCATGFDGKCHRGDQSILSVLLRYHTKKEGLNLEMDFENTIQNELETPLFPAHYSSLGMVLSRGAKRVPRLLFCNRSQHQDPFA